MQKIFIASDHGGFELKHDIIEFLTDNKYEFEDLGPYELNPDDDYPDFANKLATSVANNPESLGLLICRSGNGMVIAANKTRGAYAALCMSIKHARKAKEDDNANILVLDADYNFSDDKMDIVNAFLITNFAGTETRHGRRFKKILEIEEENFK